MVASARWPGLSELLYGSALMYLVRFISAPSCENVGTSMSFRPTTSGGEPARIAVASWLVSSLGGVRCRTTFRFLWVALNSLTSALAGPSVAWRAQKWTVPVAFTPNDDTDVDAVVFPPELHAVTPRATAAAAASDR